MCNMQNVQDTTPTNVVWTSTDVASGGAFTPSDIAPRAVIPHSTGSGDSGDNNRVCKEETESTTTAVC